MADDLTAIAQEDATMGHSLADGDLAVAALLAGYDHRHLGAVLIHLGVRLEIERGRDLGLLAQYLRGLAFDVQAEKGTDDGR